MNETADIVVVGAGSAGCVMAARLSEDSHCKVILIEAGGEDKSAQLCQPNQWPLLWNTTADWGYNTTLQSALGLRSIPYPRGKGIGGTSGINAMIAMRGDPLDFDHWRDLGNPGWGWSDVLPYFKRLEDHFLGDSYLHSSGGPLTISRQSSPSPITLAFIQAALRNGHRPNFDFNGEYLEGAGLYDVSIRNGERCSTSMAYLAPAANRPNLKIIQNSRVLGIQLDGDKAVSVELWNGTSLACIRASKEILLCAGSIDTPKLLMLSGIGDKVDLRSHRIKVVHDLPAVGKNLCDHVQTPTVFALKEPIAVTNTSVLAEGGLFFKRNDAADRFGAHIQFFAFPQVPLSFAAKGVSPAMAISAQACRPKSRGQVRLRSSDLFLPPLIDPGYLTNPEDLATQIEGVRIAREIAAHEPLASLLMREISPGINSMSDKELAIKVREASGSVWHPVGTCRMGVGVDSVVDPELRVQGLRNLRVVDASVMPQITSANTNLSTIMVAEKAVDLVKQQPGTF